MKHSWVQTEMGNLGARSFGFEQAPDTLESSIAGLVKVVSKPRQPKCCATDGRANETCCRLTSPRGSLIQGSLRRLMARSFRGEDVHYSHLHGD